MFVFIGFVNDLFKFDNLPGPVSVFAREKEMLYRSNLSLIKRLAVVRVFCQFYLYFVVLRKILNCTGLVKNGNVISNILFGNCYIYS